jgi:toxin-antitoxin system PIN domain toxin
VTRFLLDVSVLVAMHVPGNQNYEDVQQWFKATGSVAFATCAITEAGFIRVSSQLSVKNGPIDFREVRIAIANLASLPGHTYWPMDIPYLQATKPFEQRMHGHRQVTDAFLLGIAVHHGGKLATLDKAIKHLAGPEFIASVEIIPSDLS